MQSLVRTVFSRLHVLDPAAEEEKVKKANEEAQQAEIRLTLSAKEEPAVVESAESTSQEAGPLPDESAPAEQSVPDAPEVVPEAVPEAPPEAVPEELPASPARTHCR